MRLLGIIKEVFLASLPLLFVIVLVNLISPMPHEGIAKVSAGYIFVVVGQAVYLIGLEKSIIPIGRLVGGSLIKLKKTAFIVAFGLVFGLLATVAEPALSVMASQVSSINPDINRVLFVWVLGAGIGVAVGFALFRVIKNINLKIVLVGLYLAVFAMAVFVPPQFLALAFDGSGASTGDVSVPFVLALGIGVSSTMSKSRTSEESFGIIGIASVGPILAMFVYGIVLGENPNLNPYTAGQESTVGSLLLGNVGGVALAVLPILAVFLVFQFLFVRLPRKHLFLLLGSASVVFVGLYVFLAGIDIGFSYAGKYIGEVFLDPNQDEWFRWLLLAVAFVLGFSITLTEPAVTVLGEQVSDITGGHIKKGVLRVVLAVGIGFAALVSILKILTAVNILWFLVPLYAVSLLLLLFTPKLFVGLAFDSGGVSGGAITSAFLTPLTLGVSQALGQEIVSAGFGMIAFISVMPLITVQVMGIIYGKRRGLFSSRG